jgi:polar amino acid transport system substrate-binding protein
MRQADQRIAELVQAGQIRVGLFLPQYARDFTSGELCGSGTGFIALELTRILAARLGIAARAIEYPSPKAAIAGLQGGTCDTVFLGMEPSRAVEVDFAPPIFEFDYTYLVPAGSTIQRIADADRAGIRIGLVESHASALALRRLVTCAEFVGVELPDEAVDLIKHDKADLLAFPRDHLIIFAEQLPGSRVLTDRYGINRVAMAVRKGRAGWLSFASEFSQEAKASGLVRAAIEHGALRGFEVAAP